MYKRQKIVFDELDNSIPKLKTDLWREVPLKATKVGNKWTIPFESTQTGGKLLLRLGGAFDRMMRTFTDDTFQGVVHRERMDEVDAAAEPAKRSGATRWLSGAIEMESSM
jgi:hypothetical protein